LSGRRTRWRNSENNFTPTLNEFNPMRKGVGVKNTKNYTHTIHQIQNLRSNGRSRGDRHGHAVLVPVGAAITVHVALVVATAHGLGTVLVQRLGKFAIAVVRSGAGTVRHVRTGSDAEAELGSEKQLTLFILNITTFTGTPHRRSVHGTTEAAHLREAHGRTEAAVNAAEAAHLRTDAAVHAAVSREAEAGTHRRVSADRLRAVPEVVLGAEVGRR